MKIFKPIFIIITVMFISCSSYQSQHEIKLNAGNIDRPESPMYTDVLLPAVTPNLPVCLSDGKSKIPGQLENIGGGFARVWWMQPAMKAGETQNWTIFIGRSCADTRYQWTDDENGTTKLMYKDTPVMEYIYKAFDPQNPDANQKPYHQVYSPDGSQLITKGEGGLYPHHRGIFFGYRNVSIGDSLYNLWASLDGDYTEHQSFISYSVGPVFGGHSVSIDWITRNNETIMTEVRTVRAFKTQDGSNLIDFESSLESLDGLVKLGGDRQHAGVQFRAAQYVADHKQDTRYLRPQGWDQLPADQEINDEAHVDLPWNALQYSVDTQAYTVVYMSAPSNPGPADFSERKYGRFGEYIPFNLVPQDPLKLNYRFWILDGFNKPRETINKMYKTIGEPITIETFD